MSRVPSRSHVDERDLLVVEPADGVVHQRAPVPTSLEPGIDCDHLDDARRWLMSVGERKKSRYRIAVGRYEALHCLVLADLADSRRLTREPIARYRRR